jgi:hypothetical protein
VEYFPSVSPCGDPYLNRQFVCELVVDYIRNLSGSRPSAWAWDFCSFFFFAPAQSLPSF